MKKNILFALIAVLAVSTPAFAVSQAFGIGASLPAADSVTFSVLKAVQPAGATAPTFTNNGSTSLSWGIDDLTYNSTNNIWLGDHFYAIDVSPSKGGLPAPGNYASVTFAYSGETVPVGQTAGGLGTRAVLTAVKVGAADVETNLRGPQRLNAVNTLAPIVQANVSGGFLRVYVGLYTGAPSVAGAVPFTNGDAPGAYSGTLTITATLV